MPTVSTDLRTNRNQDIGRRLRIARLDAKLTPQQLGDKIGCTGKAIANMETGQVEISAMLLHSISHLLNQPISWFFQDAAPVSGKSRIEPEIYSECLGLLKQLHNSSALIGIRDVLKLAVASD